MATSTAVAFDPLTRSRTLLFLSIRDSRAPSSRFRRNHGPNARSTGLQAGATSNDAQPFVLYDQDDEDDDLVTGGDTERAQLLGHHHPKSTGGHVAIDMKEPTLPPAWVEISERVESILQTLDSKGASHPPGP
ncbi:hypothetical protein CPB86DRAFT_796641 [Serendipita vermifera]|nr:hypothetical protein CPB86DRAFT_796641 [Serendipita vermifera]